MRKTRSELTRARRERLLVKFTRPFEQGSMTGYVLDIGPKFFLLALIGDDGVRFNGFSCLQLADVRNLRVPHRYFEFLEAALKKLGQPFPNKPRVLLGTLPKLLHSASKQFPLLTIHRERADPDVVF